MPSVVVHIFKFKRKNAGWVQAVQDDPRLSESRILTRFAPKVWVQDYLWPSVLDYLEDQGVCLGNEHMHLNDMKPYHLIASEPFYEILLNIADSQPKKYGVFVKHYAQLSLPECMLNSFPLDYPRG